MQLPRRQFRPRGELLDRQSPVMMLANVIDGRINHRHRPHRPTLTFVTANDPHHANDLAAQIANRKLVGDEPVEDLLLVVPQLNPTDERAPDGHHYFVVALKVVGGMLRKKIVVRPSDDFDFGFRSQVFPERLAGADHAAAPILHKKVDAGQVFEQLLELLLSTHSCEETALELFRISA
jgi:hypothetical protein